MPEPIQYFPVNKRPSRYIPFTRAAVLQPPCCHIAHLFPEAHQFLCARLFLVLINSGRWRLQQENRGSMEFINQKGFRVKRGGSIWQHSSARGTCCPNKWVTGRYWIGSNACFPGLRARFLEQRESCPISLRCNRRLSTMCAYSRFQNPVYPAYFQYF